MLFCHNLIIRQKFTQNTFMYYNYHAKVKQVLESDTLVKIEIVDEYHGIKPAMLLYFKNHPPMPIREHKWDDYIKYLSEKPNG